MAPLITMKEGIDGMEFDLHILIVAYPGALVVTSMPLDGLMKVLQEEEDRRSFLFVGTERY